jgi:AcrR family transcriptional regulator
MPRRPAQENVRRKRAALYRSLVLEAAERVFAAQGYEDAKMQEIAAEAGVSLGTVYGVFPGKAELYRAVHDHRIDAMQARAEEAAPAGAPVLRRLLDGIAAYVGFLVEHPDFLRIHLRDGGAWGVGSTLAGGEPLEAWARGQALQIELLREGVADGTFFDDDPELLSRTIVAMQQVQLAAWVERGMREPASALVARMQAQLQRAFVRPEALAAARGAVA